MPIVSKNINFLKKGSLKILKQVEYESARRKDILMKKQEKEMRKAPPSFYVHLSRELEGTRGNSRELEGTWIYYREVVEGKKLRKGGK